MGVQDAWRADFQALAADLIGQFADTTLTVTPNTNTRGGKGFLAAGGVTNEADTPETYRVKLDWSGGPQFLRQDGGQTWQFDGTLLISAVGTDFTVAGLAAHLGQCVREDGADRPPPVGGLVHDPRRTPL